MDEACKCVPINVSIDKYGPPVKTWMGGVIGRGCYWAGVLLGWGVIGRGGCYWAGVLLGWGVIGRVCYWAGVLLGGECYWAGGCYWARGPIKLLLRAIMTTFVNNYTEVKLVYRASEFVNFVRSLIHSAQQCLSTLEDWHPNVVSWHMIPLVLPLVTTRYTSGVTSWLSVCSVTMKVQDVGNVCRVTEGSSVLRTWNTRLT